MRIQRTTLSARPEHPLSARRSTPDTYGDDAAQDQWLRRRCRVRNAACPCAASAARRPDRLAVLGPGRSRVHPLRRSHRLEGAALRADRGFGRGRRDGGLTRRSSNRGSHRRSARRRVHDFEIPLDSMHVEPGFDRESASPRTYAADVALPRTEFRVSATGIDANGFPFQRVTERLFIAGR